MKKRYGVFKQFAVVLCFSMLMNLASIPATPFETKPVAAKEAVPVQMSALQNRVIPKTTFNKVDRLQPATEARKLKSEARPVATKETFPVKVPKSQNGITSKKFTKVDKSQPANKVREFKSEARPVAMKEMVSAQVPAVRNGITQKKSIKTNKPYPATKVEGTNTSAKGSATINKSDKTVGSSSAHSKISQAPLSVKQSDNAQVEKDEPTSAIPLGLENNGDNYVDNDGTEAEADTEAPLTPTDLIVENPTDRTVQLSWTASTDNVGVVAYEVYQQDILSGTGSGDESSNPQEKASLIANIDGTIRTMKVTGLLPSTAYSFMVKAKDLAGNVSPASKSVTLTTNSEEQGNGSPQEEQPDQEPPSIPNNLKSPNQTDRTVDLIWDEAIDDIGVKAYDLYLNEELLVSLTGSELSYQVADLKASTDYIFSVRARDAAGNVSARSASLTVRTLDDKEPPTAPSGLTSSIQSETTINLSWLAAIDNVKVTAYQILNNNIVVGTVNGTETNNKLSELQPNTLYSLTVKAIDAAGNVSEPSKTLEVKTKPDTEAPKAPVLSVTAVTQTSASLRWSAAIDNIAVVAYDVYRDGIFAATVDSKTLSYTTEGLTTNKTYSFTVKAKDLANNISSSSNAVPVFTATPYEAPGPQNVTLSGMGWFSTNLKANRTFNFKDGFNSGTRYISLVYKDPSTNYLEAFDLDLSLAPSTAGTYFIQLRNSGTHILSSSDGSDFANAYPISIRSDEASKILSYSIPGGDSAYYKIAMNAAYQVGFSAAGATGMVVYDSNQKQVAITEDSAISYRAPTAGMYYVQVKAGKTSGVYPLVISSATPYEAPGPQNVTLSGMGWFSTNLKANRTFNFKDGFNSGTRYISLVYKDPSTNYLEAFDLDLSLAPSTAGTYFIQLRNSGTHILSSSDGSDFANAYPITIRSDEASKILSYSIPGGDSAYYKIAMNAAYQVGFSAAGATGMVVYDSNQKQVAITEDSAISYRAPTAGMYYVQVKAGKTSGVYPLVISSATPYEAPGPQNVTLSGMGWFSTNLKANRTFNFKDGFNSGTRYSSLVYKDPSTSYLEAFDLDLSLAPSTAGTYFIQLRNSGTHILSSSDGSDFANAYPITIRSDEASKILSYSIPGGDSAYYKIAMNAAYQVGFSAAGATGMVVYDSTQKQVAITEDSAISYRAPTAGMYYVQVKAGKTSGVYPLVISSATPYEAPGPQNVTLSGMGWFSTNLKANRTFNFKDGFNSGSRYSSLVYKDPSTNYLKEFDLDLSLAPSTAGTYFIQLRNSGTHILSSSDGSDFANAYSITIASPEASNSSSKMVPANDVAYYKVTSLTAGKNYRISASGTVGFTVYSSDQIQLAVSSGTSISFTPSTTGVYYVKLRSGTSNGNYTLNIGQNMSSADYVAPGPQNGTISSGGSTTYWAELVANRTFMLTASGATQIEFYDSLNNYISRCYNSTCAFSPSIAAGYYLKVYGTANARIIISSQDGSSFDSAYVTSEASGRTVSTNNQPFSSSAYYKVNFSKVNNYVIYARGGATGIEVYDSAQNKVISGEATTLAFAPTVAGFYYIRVLSGSTNSSYTLDIEREAVPFQAPGPQDGIISDTGYTRYAVTLLGNRTAVLNATNASKIELFDSQNNQVTTCSATSCAYIPATSGSYTYKVYGTAGAKITLSAQDGSSFRTAYRVSETKGFILVSNTQPANEFGIYSVTLTAGTAYSFYARGNRVSLYDGKEQELASGTALDFTPDATSDYYIRVSSSTTAGNFTMNMERLAETYRMPGPQASLVPTYGYVRYALTTNRSFMLQATNTTKIEIYDKANSLLTTCSSSCSTPMLAGTYFLKVYGVAGSTTALSAQDGSTLGAAYPISLTNQTGNATYMLPDNSDSYYRATLTAGIPYLLTSSILDSNNGLTVFDSTGKLLEASRQNSMSFKPPTTGTFYIKAANGGTGGSFTLKISQLVYISSETDGVLGISGNTVISNLAKWELCYGQGTSPTEWRLVKTGYTALSNGLLGNWDTNSLENGPYALKLILYTVSGEAFSSSLIMDVANRSLRLTAPSAVTDKSFTLNWSINRTPNLVRFEVYQSSVSGTNFSYANKLATISDVTLTAYLMTGLEPKKTYFYKIRAVYADGQTVDSNEIAVTTRAVTTGIQLATYQYDAVGNVLESVDPNGNVQKFEYDALNRLVAVNQPDGARLATTYDAMGRILTQIDGAGGLTSTEYDVLGQLISTTDSNGAKIESQYDDAGRIVRQVDANNLATTTSLDNMGRVIRITNPLGQSISYQYDVAGLMTKVTDANGVSRSFTYDEVGRVVTETDGLGYVTAYDYDVLGNKIKLYLPNGTRWSYGYNERNQLTTVMDPEGGTTLSSYDEAGRLKSVTDAKKQVKSYVYDSLNRVTKVTDPLGKSTQYVYDNNGNTTSIVDRNGTVLNYDYTGVNQVRSVSSGSMKPVSYTYDLAGRRVTMTDGSGTTRYKYDGAGRLTSKILGDGKTIQYAYDAAGQLVNTTDYMGAVTNREYDAAGQLIRVEDSVAGATTYTYDAGGRRIQTLTPNGITVGYSYDSNGQIVGMTHKKNDEELLLPFTYAYDSIGNMTSAADGRGKALYQYDSLNRLAEYTQADGTRTAYTYDAVGNRIAETILQPSEESLTRSYTYDAANRLTAINNGTDPAVALKYDQNGNLLSDANRTFTYDPLNQLISVKEGTNLSKYGYNGDGLRVEATSSAGDIIRFYWDDDQISLETNNSGDVIGRNLYGLERIARMQEPNSTSHLAEGTNISYYLYDGHGDVRALGDASQPLLNTYGYDAWGNVSQQSGIQKNPYGYAGEYTDSTGLQYLRARFYDPTIGRFLTEDTYTGEANDPPSLHLYSYVRNNPLIFTDPSGHVPFKAWANAPEWVPFSDAYIRNYDQNLNSGLDAISEFNPAAGFVARTLTTIGRVAIFDDLVALADSCSTSYDKSLAIIGFIPGGKFAKLAKFAKFGEEATDIAKAERAVVGKGTGEVASKVSRNQAFRDAKEAAGIPKSAQFEKHGYVFDGTSENRTAYQFTVDGQKKYIILHEEDKLGRGSHFHGADDAKGNPFDKGRYNQYDGHFPEDLDGFGK
ncbi:RHS repeat-associated protein [Paenibacillus shirakamiensis]|uniref:RHS repeat-associated protein n=1 Tax=Paenibacillus shirakamiensis TaxID=1265935 RepID=A0ABS4JJU7_9BACL|nr:fibronectin type III domain-containing protein [Paenibacillus shirakamiensis]MBP2001376.1 RHS repeat-associated protein [Paenibacillus shirakamiensis]